MTVASAFVDVAAKVLFFVEFYVLVVMFLMVLLLFLFLENLCVWVRMFYGVRYLW